MIDDLDLRVRRRLGIFYTPRTVADAIAAWAIRGPDDVILDPSYGGCVFFSAAIERVRCLSGRNISAQLYGADVDPNAEKYLALLGKDKSRAREHFHTADFLTLKPTDFGTDFDSIIGNPPYVRHHKLSKKVIKVAQRATAWCPLPERSSYWAYFLLHATKFLRRGGRLGMVLPGALLEADYAAPVWKQLLKSFADVRVILVRASMFGDAEERCVVLLADGYGGTCSAPSYVVAKSFEGLAVACKPRSGPRRRSAATPVGDWPVPLLSTAQHELFEELSARSDVLRLGEMAKIRIGVVTGANDFFVLSRSRLQELDLSRSPHVPIFSSSRQLRSLWVEPDDLERLDDADIPSLLLAITSRTTSRAVASYLASSRASRAMTRFKCQAREPWYAIQDLKLPDAFLTYVNHFSPRLVLNRAAATSTNAVHRLWWTSRLSRESKLLIALSSMTSLFGLSAELAGRGVGGGALKIEVGDAAKLLVVSAKVSLRAVEAAAQKVNDALVASEWQLARQLADDFVLGSVLRLSAQKRAILRGAHDRLMLVRIDTAGATPRRKSSKPPRRVTAPRSAR